MLERFQKLQNIALRKMLDAFKTSPINAMELEASIPPPRVRFERICKNYTWRTLQMHENHPIRLRVLSSFPPYSNGMELDWEQFQDWNEREIENSQKMNDIEIGISQGSSVSSILFLIYIRFLFTKRLNTSERILSYYYYYYYSSIKVFSV